MIKNIFFVVALMASTALFAQDWGGVDKNKVTLKEIAPTWPGCESNQGEAINTCFMKKLSSHIMKNYKYPPQAYKNNEQGKVVVEFMINEQGTVDIKNVSGGTAALQEEAKRNILAIPKMAKPGMLGGKPRAIKYTVPIGFKTGK